MRQKNNCVLGFNIILGLAVRYFGEFLALYSAFSWALTAVFFSIASKKSGIYGVSFIRLIIASLFLTLSLLLFKNYFISPTTTLENIFWLSISGIVGLIFGDLFLFKSYLLVGVNDSRIIMTLVPIFTAVLAWFVFSENLNIKQILGTVVTLTGIIVAVYKKDKNRKPFIGYLYALIGAIGQALGFVLSKYGLKGIDVFSAVQIRFLSAIIGFIFILTYLKKWPQIFVTLKNKSSMLKIFIGSFFGVYLGVCAGLLAVNYTKLSIAATLMATVPIILIPISVVFLKFKPTAREIVGSLISVFGVFIFFI